MIRQHFYPKTYFRHRSLSKSNYRGDSFLHENNQEKTLDIKRQNQNSHRIKLKRKSSLVQEQMPKKDVFMEVIATQIKSRNKYDIDSYPLKKIAKSQYINDFIHSGDQLSIDSNILKQNHNRSNIQILQKAIKNKDIQNLFIKSQKKQIINTNRNSYRVLNHTNSQNQNICIKQSNQNVMIPYSKTYRKLSSADNSKNNYRKSIQRKKRSIVHPQEIIISSNLKTLERNSTTIGQSVRKQSTIQQNDKKQLHQRRQIQFQKISNNLINLNLSKAIKYRKQSKQQKIRNCKTRKLSYRLQDIENRNIEFQQKVKGWEIQIQDDIDF